VLHTEVVPHELGDVGGLIDCEISEGFWPYPVWLRLKKVGGGGFVHGDCAWLTEVILNHGQVLCQVWAQFGVKYVHVLCFELHEVQKSVIAIVSFCVLLGDDVVVACDQCRFDCHSLWVCEDFKLNACNAVVSAYSVQLRPRWDMNDSGQSIDVSKSW